MSNVKQRMPFKDAKVIADQIVTILSPHCHRIEIAGSIRRECSYVGDIEIVAIPKPYHTGLFEDGIATVVNKWEKIKGDLEYGRSKYTQRKLPQGLNLDLFFATEGNWGLIFAIRTGSSEFSHKVLACEWARRGYTSKGGYLTQNGKIFEIREEVDLFNRLGLTFVDPRFRC